MYMQIFSIPREVNSAVVRGNAFLVILLSLTSVLLGSAWPAAFLALDFLIRGVLNPRFSLLSIVSGRVLVPLLRMAGHSIYFPPKRFAARVGLVFATAAAVSLALGSSVLGMILLLVLSVFAGLECFLNICVGCYIFNAFAILRNRFRAFRRARSVH